ncbi:MAG: NADP-dependent oxidoreductase [Bacteroidota bacterium]|nr:MAG: NADP-dependent oxidoreductase [Bacteroidota bacterium]
MQAAVLNQWGDPGVLHLADIPKPKPSEKQLMIRVFASSVNPVDFKQRKGKHRFIFGSPFPVVLGYDVCGKVVEVGSLVHRFKVGDWVFGDLDNTYGGALAEFALGHEQCFALKPDGISPEEAAGYPLAALTALQALRDKAGVKPGQTVLINGASGGVGHLALQMAKLMQANVIAVASGRNEAFISSFNPDQFIDYQRINLLSLSEKVDVFFDVIGNYSFLKTKRLLKPNGVYVTTLPRPKVFFHKLFQAFNGGKKVKTLLRKHSAADMDQIARWIEEKKLRLHIEKVFSLEQTADAHAYAEKGRTQGKNIIQIGKA